MHQKQKGHGWWLLSLCQEALLGPSLDPQQRHLHTLWLRCNPILSYGPPCQRLYHPTTASTGPEGVLEIQTKWGLKPAFRSGDQSSRQQLPAAQVSCPENNLLLNSCSTHRATTHLSLLVPGSLGCPRAAYGLGFWAIYKLQQILYPSMVNDTFPFWDLIHFFRLLFFPLGQP